MKVPATFVGHSMAVTFSMGNCTFNESKWLNDDIKVGTPRRQAAGSWAGLPVQCRAVRHMRRTAWQRLQHPWLLGCTPNYTTPAPHPPAGAGVH